MFEGKLPSLRDRYSGGMANPPQPKVGDLAIKPKKEAKSKTKKKIR